MSKLTLNNVQVGLNQATVINANFRKIETAIEDSFSKSGLGDNALTADLDINNKRVIGLRDGVLPSEPVTVRQLTGVSGLTLGTSADNIELSAVEGYTATTVQEFAEEIASNLADTDVSALQADVEDLETDLTAETANRIAGDNSLTLSISSLSSSKANTSHTHLTSDLVETSLLKVLTSAERTNIASSKSFVDNFDDADYAIVTKSINWTPAGDLDSGTATSGSTVTLIDSTQTWTVNEYAGKVCFVTDVGYFLIASNTANTLSFDTAYASGFTTEDYAILDTYTLAGEDLPCILAIDAESARGAVVMPKSAEEIERRYAHIYIEKAINGDYPIGVVMEGADTVLGQKWVTLEHRHEGFRLYCHTLSFDHWDMLNAFNIKRYAVGVTDDATAVASETYVPVNANMTSAKAKRFELFDLSGQQVFCYRSVRPCDFRVTVTLDITKTGAQAGELTATIRHYNLDGTTKADYTAFETSTRFGGGEGSIVKTFSVPVSLAYREKIGIIAKRDSQTFSIATGSTIFIEEL